MILESRDLSFLEGKLGWIAKIGGEFFSELFIGRYGKSFKKSKFLI